MNCSLSCWASWPFWTAKPDDDEAAGELDGAGVSLEVVGVGWATAPAASGDASAEGDGDGDGAELLPEPEFEGTPGDDT